MGDKDGDTIVKIYGIGRPAQGLATGGYKFVKRLKDSPRPAATRPRDILLSAEQRQVWTSSISRRMT